MGDVIKVVLLKKVAEIVERDNLVQKAASNGKYLLQEMIEIEKKHPDILHAARGKGLFLAVDVKSEKRDLFVRKMLEKGEYATAQDLVICQIESL